LTAPAARGRRRQLFEVFLDLGEWRQLGARLDLGQTGDAPRFDFQHVADFALDVEQAGVWRRPCVLRLAHRLARARQGFERNLGGAVRFPPSRSLLTPAHRRPPWRACSADSISLISARRFSAKQCRRIVEFGALGFDLVTRASMVSICEAALPLRFCHSLALGQNRLQPAVGESASRASACASARTCAARRRWPSMSVRTPASLFRCRGPAAIR